MILFVNACVRRESRTRKLAEQLLSTLNGEVKELRLEELRFPVTDESFLLARDRLLKSRDYDAPMLAWAREFAAADTVVIAAPYWDMSFPAALKQYFEQICAIGVTFGYNAEGEPVGLCRAKKLYYVTTAGGEIVSDAYGFGYVRALAQGFFGIADVECIRAEGLDLVGADTEQVMREAMKAIGEHGEEVR